MPDVVGLSLPDAEAELDGLKVEASDATGDRSIMVRGNWVVVSQEPAAGEKAEGTVRLGVVKEGEVESGGAGETSTPVPVEVPLVVAFPLNMAQEKLDAAGLRSEHVDVGDKVGLTLGAGVWEPANWTVIAQCPEGGTAPAGSAVKVGVIQTDEYPDDLRSLVGRGELPDVLDCA